MLVVNERGSYLIISNKIIHIFTLKQEAEISEMRQTIELLKKQSIHAGLTSTHIESMGVQVNANGGGSITKKSLNGSHESELHNGSGQMQRQLSTDSVCSLNSLSSNCSTQEKKKKKGWVSPKISFLLEP